MQRNNGARFFPLIIIVVIVALVIAAIVSIGRAVLNPSDNSGDPTEVSQLDQARQALLDTSTGSAVQLTVRGPLVAQEEFTSYRIMADNGERSMKVYKGYLEEETDGKELSNNTQAYEQFVYALDKANMMKGAGNEQEAEEGQDDLRGICATGYVYEYAVLSGGNEAEKLWTSTCDGSKGTLDASRDQLNELFLAQIPDSDELIPFRQSPMLRL